MKLPARVVVSLLAWTVCRIAGPESAEDPAPLPPARQVASPTQVNYPDTQSGLQNLVNDLLRAQKAGDTTRSTMLAQSMVLANIPDWYERVFGEYTAQHEGAEYLQNSNDLQFSLLQFFQQAREGHFNQVFTRRFDSNCDDDAGEDATAVLDARLQSVPLYELRLMNGDHFRRLWAFAYVDNAFRFIKVPQNAEFNYSHTRNLTGAVPSEPQENARVPLPRIKQGGVLAASKLVKKVTPEYPEKAKREHLQGTVRFHVIIGKDGSVLHPSKLDIWGLGKLYSFPS